VEAWGCEQRVRGREQVVGSSGGAKAPSPPLWGSPKRRVKVTGQGPISGLPGAKPSEWEVTRESGGSERGETSRGSGKLEGNAWGLGIRGIWVHRRQRGVNRAA
jgi:hypothetical protein